jgi:hypothetical protein
VKLTVRHFEFLQFAREYSFCTLPPGDVIIEYHDTDMAPALFENGYIHMEYIGNDNAPEGFHDYSVEITEKGRKILEEIGDEIVEKEKALRALKNL